MNKFKNNTNWVKFLPLLTVFFFWGFVAASNDILIPVFRKAFNLNQFHSQLVSLSFYIAYTVGSLIYLLISYFIKEDLINRLGYKNSLVLGLIISAIGTLLFYPAANTSSFILMLVALFIVALGFSLQQIVANPLAIALGPLYSGSKRLTMAGGINNLGTTIGPLIVSFAIFGSVTSNNSNMDIESVKIPYLVLGAIFLLVSILLKFSSIPNNIEILPDDFVFEESSRGSALKYPQLIMGMIAIFVYVGVEVSTASNLPSYMEKKLDFMIKDIAPYISLYWASLMIGRWTGAVEVFTSNHRIQKKLRLIMPYLAYGVFLIVNYIAKHDLSPFYIYALIIVVLIIADIFSYGNPARMLFIFSVLGILALVVGMTNDGIISIYAFTSVGLFCSNLWPCIFTLSITGLGRHTTQGSSLLIMMIMGGGIISLLQGYISDVISVQFSFIVGVICFLYLAFFAWKVTIILRKQGVKYMEKSMSKH